MKDREVTKKVLFVLTVAFFGSLGVILVPYVFGIFLRLVFPSNLAL